MRSWFLLLALLLPWAGAAQTYKAPSYPVLVFHSAGSVSGGASTGEQNLATVPIPANVLGAGGQIRLSFGYLNNNNANTKTFTIRLNTTAGAVTGGFAAMSVSNTTNTTYTGVLFINNTATNVQQSTNATGTVGAAANTPAAGSIDTTAATFVNFNGNKVTDGADTITLTWWHVEVVRSGTSYFGG